MARSPHIRIVAAALILAVAASISFLPSLALGQGGPTTLVLLHTADYHSHAVPHYSEGQQNVGGLARLIQYYRDQKAADPNSIILSGGDTMNLGTPAWSDKYQCAEWTWFSGLTEAMALGNHEQDYGWDTFQKCRASVEYPVLTANFIGPNGEPILTGWTVIERAGLRLGVFALAGNDFEKLIKPADRPEGSHFVDGLIEAPVIVQHLRDIEHVNAVVMIGHRSYEEDVRLALGVPGIDVILGTHSHRKEDLKQIPDTTTWIISPFQYIEYVSRLELTFDGGKLTNVGGGLVRMSPDRPEAPDIAEKVAGMQKELEADPKFASRFEKLGQASVEISDANLSSGESILGDWVQDTVRTAGAAQVSLSTASSFRAAIPPGDITVEDYLTAVPYKNLVLVHKLTGEQLQQILDYSVSKKGTDNFSQVSGVRFEMKDGKATNVQVLADPVMGPSDMASFQPLDPAATYLVATTDFQAKIAPGYSDIFKQAASVKDTGLIVNDLMMQTIRTTSPISAALDGRIK